MILRLFPSKIAYRRSSVWNTFEYGHRITLTGYARYIALLSVNHVQSMHHDAFCQADAG
jgi:hypothetical protein